MGQSSYQTQAAAGQSVLIHVAHDWRQGARVADLDTDPAIDARDRAREIGASVGGRVRAQLSDDQ